MADALLDLYGRSEMAASILLRGAEGFGLRQHLRTDRSLTLSEDLPLVTVAVDTRPRIEAVLEQTLQLNRPGLVTLERAVLLDGTAARPRTELARRPAGTTAKLTVYLGRQERAYRVPAFVAVCDLLYRRGIAGATALLGVDGTSRGTAPAGPVLRPQRGRADDDHRRRLRGADRAASSRSWAGCCTTRC